MDIFSLIKDLQQSLVVYDVQVKDSIKDLTGMTEKLEWLPSHVPWMLEEDAIPMFCKYKTETNSSNFTNIILYMHINTPSDKKVL